MNKKIQNSAADVAGAAADKPTRESKRIRQRAEVGSLSVLLTNINILVIFLVWWS